MDHQIKEVDEDCFITYLDGTRLPCEHQPAYTFSECGPGYGPNRGCAKYDYYHRRDE